MIFKIILLSISISFQCGAAPLAEQFKQAGYAEITGEEHGETTFDSLYRSFDALIDLLQTNPIWAHKLYTAKERFIRSQERNIYSTNFFGFYDESKRKGRSQIAFYYSSHFHSFIHRNYPELIQVHEINSFLEACLEIQKPYGQLCEESAKELGLETIFSSAENSPPILFKVIKYLPDYIATRPHYDGSLFSLFLHSSDNQSLLLSPYKTTYEVEDFFSPGREFSQSILLIPGTLLAEYAIYPTPHIVAQTGKIRYSTVAFVMRPSYTPEKFGFTSLPNFQD